MAEGQRAAEQTKGFFHQAGEASESLRQNVNSFADNLLGGNKQHSSTGVHPDAKKTVDEMAKGVGAATGEVEKVVDRNKRT